MKKRKQKEYKLTKKDWIEILEFWPLSIVVPAMLILILFGSYLGEGISRCLKSWNKS